MTPLPLPSFDPRQALTFNNSVQNDWAYPSGDGDWFHTPQEESQEEQMGSISYIFQSIWSKTALSLLSWNHQSP
jgi:hypothetical protein